MSPVRKSSAAFVLQVAIALIGIGALVLLLWEPHLEGRNARATTFQIYFKDPFLAYVYLGSIPFFVALCRAFGLFGDVRKTDAFSQRSVDALWSIRKCAIALMGFIAGGAVFILMFGDERPAGVFMSLLLALVAGAMAITATVFARKLRKSLGQPEEIISRTLP